MASGTISRARRQAVLARDGETCQYCGFPGYEVDHIVPLAWTRVGAHDLANLVCCCRRCNGLLGSQVFDGFEAKKRFIRDTLWPVPGLPSQRPPRLPKPLSVPPRSLDPLGVWPGSQGHTGASQVAHKPLKPAPYAKGYEQVLRARLSCPKPRLRRTT
jgi:HNH endonuclease